MIVVERASRFEASADRMWQLFDTEDGQRRSERGFVSSITFEGQGLGMVRTMRTDGIGCSFARTAMMSFA